MFVHFYRTSPFSPSLVCLFVAQTDGRPLEQRQQLRSVGPPAHARQPVPAQLQPYVWPTPVELPPGAAVAQVSGGSDHSLILVRNKDDRQAGRGVPDWRGRVLSFGDAAEGELGHGDRLVRTKPEPIAALEGRHIVAVAAGYNFSLVLTDAGEVGGFGDNACGQLGDGTAGTQRTLPVWMLWVARETVRVVAIAAGRNHSVLLSAAGSVFTLGDGSAGQLGHGGRRSETKPRPVAALAGLEVETIAAGGDHTAALTRRGLLYTWGSGSSGQLGHGDDRADQLVPRRLAHPDLRGGPHVRPADLHDDDAGGLRADDLAGHPFALPTEGARKAASDAASVDPYTLKKTGRSLWSVARGSVKDDGVSGKDGPEPASAASAARVAGTQRAIKRLNIDPAVTAARASQRAAIGRAAVNARGLSSLAGLDMRRLGVAATAGASLAQPEFLRPVQPGVDNVPGAEPSPEEWAEMRARHTQIARDARVAVEVEKERIMLGVEAGPFARDARAAMEAGAPPKKKGVRISEQEADESQPQTGGAERPLLKVRAYQSLSRRASSAHALAGPLPPISPLTSTILLS